MISLVDNSHVATENAHAQTAAIDKNCLCWLLGVDVRVCDTNWWQSVAQIEIIKRNV